MRRTRSALARSVLAVVVAVLCVVGIAASVSYFFRESYNPGFAEFAAIVRIHVVLGAIYLALAPFQFVAAIRSRAIGYHRWVGRTLVLIGTVIGAAALFMSLVIPIAGWPERVVVGSFSTFYLIALAQAVRHIRAKRIALHREWMIRAFAIALAIATTRIIGVILISVSDDRSFEHLKAFFNASLTAALLLHAVVAEAWIRWGARIIPGRDGDRETHELGHDINLVE